MGHAQAQLIGRKVKNRREAKGLRPEDLAAATGLGIQTIARVEKGATERMRLHTAVQLASALDMEIEELRPPEPEDEETVLRQVLARLIRIEEALGVSENGRSEEGGDPAEIAEQTAAEVEAEQSSAKPDRKRQQSA